MTFVSTAHAVAYNRLKIVFADIDYDTLNIDICDVRRKITSRTSAIIPVHYGGRPVDMDELLDASQGAAIIEDCAHASGSTCRGKRVGTIGDIGCFSFHAVKNLAMGEGGAITTRDRNVYERAKRLRWLGIDKGTWDRVAGDKSYWWEYEVNEIGYKYHLNDISAAIGLVQLEKLQNLNGKRKRAVDIYREELAGLREIIMPPDDDDAFVSSWHLCEIKAPECRNELAVHMKNYGVSTGLHYKPIHLYRCYGETDPLPNAEKAFRHILTIPSHANLSDADISHVANSIKSFFA